MTVRRAKTVTVEFGNGDVEIYDNVLVDENRTGTGDKDITVFYKIVTLPLEKKRD